MDDLSSISWAPSKPQQNNAPASNANYYPTLRPTPPISGRSSPAVNGSVQQKPLGNTLSGGKPSTPSNDSFANLVAFNGVPQSGKQLSLQDQQRAIQEKKLKEEEERRRQFDGQFTKAFGAQGSGTAGISTGKPVQPPFASSPFGQIKQPSPFKSNILPFNPVSSSHQAKDSTKDEEEADILAAFNSSAPVDKSSHMPPVSAEATGSGLRGSPAMPPTSAAFPNDDDDPFGLGTSAPGAKPPAQHVPATVDDDDVLGDLSKPISEFSKPVTQATASIPAKSQASSDPRDRAMAELLDMGFPPEKARRALDSTDSGSDVQAAVGWILNQAHEDSRKDKQQRSTRRDSVNGASSQRHGSRRKSSGGGASKPAWMKDQGRTHSGSSRNDAKPAANGERDPAQIAQQLGNNLFKTAGSLWKTGTKKLNQAVAEFNTDADPSQPKWMREANGAVGTQKPASRQRADDAQDHNRMRRAEASSKATAGVTNEAMLLDSGDGRPPRKQGKVGAETSVHANRVTSPNSTNSFRAPQADLRSKDPTAKLTRHAVEEEASAAYISPARRRRPAAKAEPEPPAPEPDLLFGDSKPPVPSQRPQANTLPTRPRTKPTPTPSILTRPSAPSRIVPSVSPNVLSQSTLHRQTGTEAFKRGDYAAATTSYTTALSQLPQTHPLRIPLLTNRALSHSKNGDPKASIVDAEAVIAFIGPSRGIGESIDVGGADGTKPMDQYWGKAQTRLAESLEHLERYAEALTAWRLCVEAGVGGATSIAGRNRCENALRPKPAPKASAPRVAPARPRPSALNDFGNNNNTSSEAVTRLRVANAAAEKADDEKFRLADVVDGRVKAWRNGKEGNLRALLSSLENVLWAEAGWKKVGMGEVIQSNRVKIVYMKGIAKVHPDKLPTTATTEQKMISAAVFATLNEAWERFKAENGM